MDVGTTPWMRFARETGFRPLRPSGPAVGPTRGSVVTNVNRLGPAGRESQAPPENRGILHEPGSMSTRVGGRRIILPGDRARRDLAAAGFAGVRGKRQPAVHRLPCIAAHTRLRVRLSRKIHLVTGESMNFRGDFLRLGMTDVSALRERVMAFTEEDWNRDNWRRTQFKAHQQTTTIPLIFDEDFRHARPTIRPDYAALRAQVEPVLALIRRHYDQDPGLRRLQDDSGPAYPVRILLARLCPGGVIPAHMDRIFSLAHAHRVHVPVVTHEDVKFVIDGRRQPMREGEIWEINNRRAHQV